LRGRSGYLCCRRLSCRGVGMRATGSGFKSGLHTAKPSLRDMSKRHRAAALQITATVKSPPLSPFDFAQDKPWPPALSTVEGVTFPCYPCLPWQRPVISNQSSVIPPSADLRRWTTPTFVHFVNLFASELPSGPEPAEGCRFR